MWVPFITIHQLLFCVLSWHLQTSKCKMASLINKTIITFFLLLLHHATAAQTNITLGQSITAGSGKGSDRWLSPSGDFAFGFNQQVGTGYFLLSIWYDKIPEKTIVWYPSTFPGPVPRGSKLKVTSDRGPLLSDPRGESLWSPETLVAAVSGGFLDDSGNFRLSNDNSETVWETFANPSDTLLPGQEIHKNGPILSSRKSFANNSQGRFRLMLQAGTLQLTSVNLPSTFLNGPYYSPDATGNSVTGIGFNGSSGYLYLLHQDGQRSSLTVGKVVSAANYYLRATLEFDGVFIQYSYPKDPNGDRKWSPVWLAPDNICLITAAQQGSGTCGYNRICRLDAARRPVCECPRGFSLLDPADEYRGCIADFTQGCSEGDRTSPQDEFVIQEVSNIDWPFSDYEKLTPFQKDGCRDSCLQDCMCAVAIFRDNTCWKKKLPLSNGRIDPSLNGIAFIKGRKYDTGLKRPDPPGPDGSDKDSLILAGSVLLGSSVFVNFILIGAIVLGFFLIYQKKLTRIFRDESGLDVHIHCFTYKELEAATAEFKEELGRGSFGIVYNGTIEMGNSIQQVAIKKLDRLFQENEREFKTEVLVIGQTHHKNLVRLLGYCNEGQNRLLVYEFLSNGTLARFLFEDDLKPSWDQRTQIALDVGRGLLYLHEECSTQIIHCDIKPQNILLDEYYNARISDFGLAKLLLMSQTQTHTAIRGTRGYVAPEWFRNMPITTKVDVYSFGILLLEVVSCSRSVDVEAGGEERVILADWAYDCYREKRLDMLVRNDEEAMNDMKKLERFVMVAVWCIQEDPSLRPTMKRVMLMLEGVIQVPVPPCPFLFGTFSTNSFSPS